MSRQQTTNARHNRFKEEAMKPGPMADSEMVQRHADSYLGTPVPSTSVTDDFTTITMWVLLACLIAKIPDILSILKSK